MRLSFIGSFVFIDTWISLQLHTQSLNDLYHACIGFTQTFLLVTQHGCMTGRPDRGIPVIGLQLQTGIDSCCRSGNFHIEIFLCFIFVWFSFCWWAYQQKSRNALSASPCPSSFLEKCHAVAAACWLAYSPITDGRAGLYLHGPHLPTSSQDLSCLLHLLINSVIAYTVMVADSNPLGSGRAPTGDAAEPSSPCTRGGVR